MTADINKEGKNGGSFMLPIWLITIMTMIGTSSICYAYHLYNINKQHQDNMEQIHAVEFRTEKYSEYRDLIKKEGKNAAILTLKKQ